MGKPFSLQFKPPDDEFLSNVNVSDCSSDFEVNHAISLGMSILNEPDNSEARRKSEVVSSNYTKMSDSALPSPAIITYLAKSKLWNSHREDGKSVKISTLRNNSSDSDH